MTIEQLKQALIAAHNKGDKQAANLFAEKIKAMQAQGGEQRQVGPTGVDYDVPVDENLIAQPKPERTLGEKAIGLGEAALTLATGATTGAAGFLGGAAEGVLNELTGKIESGKGLEQAAELAAAGTFEPKTEAGKEIIQFITEKLGALPPIIGSAPSRTGQTLRLGENLGKVKRVTKLKAQDLNRVKSALASEIRAGNIHAGNIAKTLDADGLLIPNKNLKNAIKMLGDNDEAYSSAINFERMNNATRQKVSRMLNSIERNKQRLVREEIMENRPANVIGESLGERALKLDKIRKKSSERISAEINGELGKKQINIAKPLDKFLSDLNNAGVKISQGQDGKIIVDSSESLVNFGEVLNDKKLSATLNRVKNGTLSGKEAHQLKRQLRENVSFDAGKIGSAPVSSDAANAIKEFTSGINDALGAESKVYANANKTYSSVIDSLKTVDTMLGKNLLIGDKLAENKLGSLAKRIGTNLASKENVYKMIDEIDEALRKNKVKGFDDDIRQLVGALVDMEQIFKLEGAQAPFGIQSRFTKGALDAVSVASPGLWREGIDFVGDAFRNMTKLEFEDKMKALRAMSRER